MSWPRRHSTVSSAVAVLAVVASVWGVTLVTLALSASSNADHLSEPHGEALRAQGPGAGLTQFAADWFHPNDRGHRVWADAFWQQIQGAGVAPARS